MGNILIISTSLLFGLLLTWFLLRDTLPFSKLPMRKYRILLEAIVAFIPAAAAGWLLSQLSQVSLEDVGKTMNLGWVLWIIVCIAGGGLLMVLSAGMSDNLPKDAGEHDLIAVGAGLLAGLSVGLVSLLVLDRKPPQVLYTFWDTAPIYFGLACLIGLLLIVLVVIGFLVAAKITKNTSSGVKGGKSTGESSRGSRRRER